jgi:hypothetical protein
MEANVIETKAVESAVEEAALRNLHALTELSGAYAAGGLGEVIAI